VLPAGVGNGVELWLGEGEAHSARPICPVSLPQEINELGADLSGRRHGPQRGGPDPGGPVSGTI
jgi:hypothetical protein